MDRRTFIAGTLSLLAAPLAAGAQPAPKLAQIGLLSLSSPLDVALWYRAFHQGLASLGGSRARTSELSTDMPRGRTERLPDLAADLVRLKVDAIVTSLNTDAVAA